MSVTRDYILMLGRLMDKKVKQDSRGNIDVYFDGIIYYFDNNSKYLHNFYYTDNYNYEGINFELSEEEINEKLFNCRFRKIHYEDFYRELKKVLDSRYKLMESMIVLDERVYTDYCSENIFIKFGPTYLEVVIKESKILYVFNMYDKCIEFIYTPRELIEYIENVVMKRVVKDG